MTRVAAKYDLERRLGGGGMAEVFLAQTVGAEGFSRPVAIKRVLPTFSGDAQFAAMFVNEAKLSARIRHPNVVQVLDFDRDGEGRLFLVMELVEGVDLSDVIERGALPVPAIVYVTVEVLKGLAHAHELTEGGQPLGIVHRDISPHNVLVSWGGDVKLSDFGIAKAMLATSSRSGMIKGKPLYMAPEQVTAPDAIDHRADLFAVGVMLYEMLTGQRLYRGTTNEEVLTDIVQVAHGLRAMTEPARLRGDVPWDVSQVTMRLLAPDRTYRMASARDAIDALLATSSATPRGGDLLADLLAERFPDRAPPRAPRRGSSGAPVLGSPSAETRTMPPPPSGRGLAAGTPPAPATPAALPAPPAAPVRARRWPLAVAAGVVAVGAAAIAIVAATGGGGGAPPASEPGPAPAAGGAAQVPDAGTANAGAPPDDAVSAAPDAGAPVAPDAAPAAGPEDRPDDPEPRRTRPKPKPPRSGGEDSRIHEIPIPSE